jgi:hypothetical protein
MAATFDERRPGSTRLPVYLLRTLVRFGRPAFPFPGHTPAPTALRAHTTRPLPCPTALHSPKTFPYLLRLRLIPPTARAAATPGCPAGRWTTFPCRRCPGRSPAPCSTRQSRRTRVATGRLCIHVNTKSPAVTPAPTWRRCRLPPISGSAGRLPLDTRLLPTVIRRVRTNSMTPSLCETCALDAGDGTSRRPGG